MFEDPRFFYECNKILAPIVRFNFSSLIPSRISLVSTDFPSIRSPNDRVHRSFISYQAVYSLFDNFNCRIFRFVSINALGLFSRIIARKVSKRKFRPVISFLSPTRKIKQECHDILSITVSSPVTRYPLGNFKGEHTMRCVGRLTVSTRCSRSCKYFNLVHILPVVDHFLHDVPTTSRCR